MNNKMPLPPRSLPLADRIEKRPGVCGGSACVRGTRIPVWCIVNKRRLGMDDAEILDSYPSINEQDLLAAWEYGFEHQHEIDTDIRENEAGEEGLVA